MKAKVINEGPERTIALIFDRGDEVVSILQRFASEHNLSASRFSAIGTFESAVLGYFDWERKDYDHIAVGEQVEVTLAQRRPHAPSSPRACRGRGRSPMPGSAP